MRGDALSLNRDEELFWRGLNRLVLRLPRALGEDFEGTTAISEPEISVLAKLYDAPDGQLSMSQLAERTSLSPSRITRVVNLMNGRGLLSKQVGLGDRRMLYATLTSEGRRAYKRTEPEVLRLIRRELLDHMTSEEVVTADAVLHQLVEAIDGSRPSSGGGPADPRTTSLGRQGRTPVATARAHEAPSTPSPLPPSSWRDWTPSMRSDSPAPPSPEPSGQMSVRVTANGP